MYLITGGLRHYIFNKFIIIEKFPSVENEFPLKDGLLLNGYFFLNSFKQSDEKAVGLDKSDVLVDDIPLLYNPVQQVELTRINN